MLEHAFKRMLVLLPAVWLVASLVFLLSKIIPGTGSEIDLETAAQNANSRAKAAAYQRAHKQFLRRTGQDLPLFYVSLGTAAEPDTLYRITLEADRQALKKLILTYGNWKHISPYYTSWQQL